MDINRWLEGYYSYLCGYPLSLALSKGQLDVAKYLLWHRAEEISIKEVARILPKEDILQICKDTINPDIANAYSFS